MRPTHLLITGLALLGTFYVPPVAAANRAPRPRPPVVSAYAELADRTLSAPVVLSGSVEEVDRVNEREAPGLKPGSRRYLIELSVASALKAPGAVPARVRFLWDVPSEVRPDLLKEPVIAFLTQQTLSDYRLTRPDGLIEGTGAAESTIRSIIQEAKSPDLLRRRVTGVQTATSTPGTIPGEAETQIFLSTASGDPISLIIVSRPGEEKKLTAAFGDVIDEAAAPVKADTLGWFYLACGLPATLPDSAVDSLESADAARARADYQFALKTLGSCPLRAGA